ncbi:hypothetical protein FSP39_016969 [Pinctada imbricata]|uniref:exodeoxyribonuclease III n=1 Tax=Pinctada imbricata TaxID=66713 RepID=A0AA89BXD9_PINIB|nr:hypothetical protein FSP39_016969 [Pinctada imbricata]
MAISLATLNVNGLRNREKRNNLFYWLKKKNYDVIALQETHCTDSETAQWENEWKSIGGGESYWNNGTSASKGVGILVGKNIAFEIKEIKRDKQGRIGIYEVKKDEKELFRIINIYSPNTANERKTLFNELLIYTTESSNNNKNNILMGDFNCTLSAQKDRFPPQRTEDSGNVELKDLLSRANLCDIWRLRNPDEEKFTFKRGNSKSRIDMILIPQNLNSDVAKICINNCLYSDHALVYTSLKTDEIERGPGNTTNFLNHIEHEHDGMKQSSSSGSKPKQQQSMDSFVNVNTAGKINPERQDKIDDALCKFIAGKAVPLSIVDNILFRTFIGLLDPSTKSIIQKSETEGIQNQDKTGTKANKQKPPPYEKKRTPDMGVRSGAQEE